MPPLPFRWGLKITFWSMYIVNAFDTDGAPPGFLVKGVKGGGGALLAVREFLWNVFSQTMTVGLKPVALPEGVGIYSRLSRLGAPLCRFRNFVCFRDKRVENSIRI